MSDKYDPSGPIYIGMFDKFSLDVFSIYDLDTSINFMTHQHEYVGQISLRSLNPFLG